MNWSKFFHKTSAEVIKLTTVIGAYALLGLLLQKKTQTEIHNTLGQENEILATPPDWLKPLWITIGNSAPIPAPSMTVRGEGLQHGSQYLEDHTVYILYLAILLGLAQVIGNLSGKLINTGINTLVTACHKPTAIDLTETAGFIIDIDDEEEALTYTRPFSD